MEKQSNTKLPVVFLSDYRNDPITGKPKCALTIGLPTSTMDNFDKIDNELFQKDIIYNCTHDENGNIILTNNVGWTKHGVISNVGVRCTDDINCDICSPCILRDSDGMYRIWYTSNDDFCDRIHYATSEDGIHWNEYGIVLDVGADGDTDSYYVCSPCVIEENGIYKMWYTGSDDSHIKIHYATSENGVDWTKHGVVLDAETNADINSLDVRDPCVIKENGIYKMWYYGHDNSHDRIHYATSEDGIHWNEYGVVLNVGANGDTDGKGIWDPFVLKDLDDIYRMWYSGYDGSHFRIHYATSENGVNWDKHGVVLNVGADGDTDDTDTCDPFVIKENGICKMWYTGDNNLYYRIHYATFHNLIANTMGSTSESPHPLLKNPNVSIANHALTEDWGAKGLTITNGANNPYTFITREIQLESDDQNQLEVLVNNTIEDITGKLKQVKQQNLKYNHTTLQCSMI